MRYSHDEIVAFARLSGDQHALHHDRVATQRASFGEIMASEQQTSSRMMGVVASYFASHEDGIAREVLSLNFNFAFRRPVFAEQDVQITWRVREVAPSASRGGCIGHLDGKASVGGRACVIGRGTVAVRRR